MMTNHITPDKAPASLLIDLTHKHANVDPRNYTTTDLLLKHIAYLDEERRQLIDELEDLEAQ